MPRQGAMRDGESLFYPQQNSATEIINVYAPLCQRAGYDPKLTMLALRLLDHIIAESGEAGVARIKACDLAPVLGVTRRTVSRLLRRLEDRRYIVRPGMGRSGILVAPNVA
ncbi:MAG: helix-turn-helix domain-containing protein [Acidimicrobiales bacterium]